MQATRRVRLMLLVAGLALGPQACVSSTYSGQEYAPTQHVEVFHDDAAVPPEYVTMGSVRTTATPGMSLESIQFELVDQARRRGADAIVVDRVQLETIGYRADSASGQAEHVTPAGDPSAAEGGQAIRQQVVTARLLKRTPST
ncbi:MAG: hypothetical protein KDA22_13525 [Phycisphaerales bacterium]|nr:hypothetical protein [Phycisphaerales bacterium]